MVCVGRYRGEEWSTESTENTIRLTDHTEGWISHTVLKTCLDIILIVFVARTIGYFWHLDVRIPGCHFGRLTTGRAVLGGLYSGRRFKAAFGCY